MTNKQAEALIKVWSKEYNIDFKTNTVTLPGNQVANLADIATLVYLLHMRAENDMFRDILSLGKANYLALFRDLPKDSPFLRQKLEAMDAMEDF